ncbi:MAG: (2E,6E)-farnesyl diphosphate synthase [Gammaproteobacteria bacterium]|nr:(2E,6E)-farnesyl diphosphate synthase [Gammaproteobacteria bacterium]
MPTDFENKLNVLRQRVDAALDLALPSAEKSPTQLHAAMRYAVTAGGKRIRPVLVYACGQALNISLDKLDAAACAVEMIHAYSLVHDDLPAMDDDDLRRGQPTCHIAFDEATAILAGDALQAMAFEVLLQAPIVQTSATHGIALIRTLAHASGSLGMAGGQAIDLAAVDQQLNLAELENMHRHKTGALIEACALLACDSSEQIAAAQRQALRDYARHVGLAFQIQDDILDVIADTSTLGKTQGADIARNKPTYPSLLGLDGARVKLNDTHAQALAALSEFDDSADLLRQIADYIVQRSY